MYSIGFPNMLSGATTNLISGKEATMSNLKLLLGSIKTSLLGDPFFGTNLKRYIYGNNDVILRDLIIDEIYTSIIEFMPQVYLQRNNITVVQNGVDMYANIECINTVNNELNLYVINLTSD